MRKLFIASILVITCCLFVGCKKDPKDPKPSVDTVVSINVCEEFYNTTFYINDVIDLQDYSVSIVYESGKTDTVLLSSFGFRYLNTVEAGNKSFNITYKEKTKIVNYVVNDICPVSLMYKGDCLELYRGEDIDYKNIKVSVLFNNGEEKNIGLDEFIVGDIESQLSKQERYFSATYKNLSVNIPYTVTNRQIEEGKDYLLNDTLNIFNESSVYIRFIDGFYIVHSGTGVIEEKPKQTAEKCEDYNRYSSLNNIGGVPKTFYFYLVGDTIYCEL